MKKVSVIVPVYNAEPFLRECVDSILSQSYPAIELILIDNYSKDGSLAICKEYEKQYDNVICVAFHDNMGPSEARNYGIKIATGEYIGFCDSDDYIELDMYRDMVQMLESSDLDYVIADMYAERIQSELGLPWDNEAMFEEEDIKQYMIPEYIGNESDNDTKIPVWGSVVKCLFRKSIIDENYIMFPKELNFAEDLVFTLRYLICAKKASVLTHAYYYYRYNVNSLMNSYVEYKPKMTESRVMLINELTRVLKLAGIYDNVRQRLNVTVRCYMQECIGNACKNRTFFSCYREVRAIMRLDITKEAFQKFDANSTRKKIVYKMIKRKAAIVLTIYYRMRNRKRK